LTNIALGLLDRHALRVHLDDNDEAGITQQSILNLRQPVARIVGVQAFVEHHLFKAGVFSQLGVQPRVTHRPVGCDLRDDWATALRGNGFDGSRPTAWSAEGLLMYLPPDAQDRLFDTISALSGPQSQLATEYHRDDLAEVSRRIVSDVRWRVNGFDIDTAELIYGGKRRSVRNCLAAQGWSVVEQTRVSLFEEYGLSTPEDDAPMRNVVAVTAHLD
jgi:O-methyltransferase involved in polyketide biosynthesis